MDILLYLAAIFLLIAPWFLFEQTGVCQGVERFNQEYGHSFKDERIRQALEESGQAGDLFLKLRLSQSHPIWDTNLLPSHVRQDLEKLKQNKQIIKQESDQALKCAYLWKRNEDASSFWYTFSFAWMEEQCRECPELVKILHQLDGLLTDCLFGNAFLSMLPRGSVIEEHMGMTNARLRLHFGVEVPKDEHNCYMVVGGQRLHWKEGKSVVFDDSFKHSVSSRNCKEDRIVLVLDLWNPQLQAHEKECLSKIFPAIYTQ
uniref:Aspartyl/asparaginy/proline hydroxylase domain-containing protein n=1 Tax=Ditylenchus dipsaci TaxID=166011 RepID=A0A915EU05_9BILA